MTVSGTSVEMTVCDQPKGCARPMAIATKVPSVKTIAPKARHDRYVRNTSVIKNKPNSGMKRAVAAPVCRSSHASNHGEPTRRTWLKGPPLFSSGSASESIALRATSRSAGDAVRSSSATPK
jgi:hypothetical protein